MALNQAQDAGMGLPCAVRFDPRSAIRSFMPVSVPVSFSPGPQPACVSSTCTTPDVIRLKAETDITNCLLERAKSPNLTIDLPSNNPFRNRANSPNTPNSLPSPQNLIFNPQTAPPERPRSRNPFLDHPEPDQPNLIDPISTPSSPQKAMAAPESPKRGQLFGNTAELFVGPSVEVLLGGSALIPVQRTISPWATHPPMRMRAKQSHQLLCHGHDDRKIYRQADNLVLHHIRRPSRTKRSNGVFAMEASLELRMR